MKFEMKPDKILGDSLEGIACGVALDAFDLWLRLVMLSPVMV